MPEIFVDGRAYSVRDDQPLLQACLELGFDLPYFCWHPAMGSVGACRQCAVLHFKDDTDEAAGHGRLVMSCMTAVADGIRIGLVHPTAADFRRSVIGGMMLNHPHDCPVCDEGGHCHLQDMTVMTGHNYRRYRFQKRVFRNQYLGPLLNHEMNRCIQCYRCVRFYQEYAGGADFAVSGISDHTFFGRAADGVFESEFAGNLAEVCPTGVFTDATLKRHYTRKWDLRWTPSICPFCSLGCNISPGERYGAVRAVVNRYHGEINGYFLCDRGRFGYEYLDSPQRLRQPRLNPAEQTGEAASEVTPAAALAHLAKRLREAAAGPAGSLIGIGSPRASVESNFALRRLVGPECFYAGMPPGQLELARRMLELLRVLPAPSLRQIEHADAALVLGEDLTQTAARMALSLRQLVRQQPLREVCDPLHIPHWLDHAAREAIQEVRGPLFIASPAPTKLDDIARRVHRAATPDTVRLGFGVATALIPGAPAAADPLVAEIAAALAAAARPVIIAGSSGNSLDLLDAAAAVVQALQARGRQAMLSLVPPDANTLGLALLNPHPLTEALDRIRFGDADTVVALECDLARLAPEDEVEACFARLATGGRHLVALDQLDHRTTRAAELALPAAGFAEGDGTLINNEGRAQRFFQVLAPSDEIRESWRWLEQAQARDPALDELIAQIAAELPELAPIRDAAPPASFRLAQQKMPRETHRFSGRTAIRANLAVSEPKPPEDPDAPLTYTMEGYQAQPPAALTPFFWSPGWNSPQAQLTYQSEINAALRGGDAGALIFTASTRSDVGRVADPSAGRRTAPTPPEPFSPRPNQFWVERQFHLFGSEELSREARALASLAPAAYVALSPADAAARGWLAGQPLAVQLGARFYQVPLCLLEGLPPGVAALPAGFAAFDGVELPAWCAINAAPPASAPTEPR